MLVRGVSVSLVLLWVALALAPERRFARAVPPVTLPLQLHVVHADGKPVADADFLASQVERARRVFEQAGVDFIERKRLELPAKHAALVSRADRDALTGYVTPSTIHAMVVASLMDVDEPGRVRRGVHWTSRRDPKKHFVIVSAISGPYVLAHELGHFLGNRDHSKVPGNIMSYLLTEALPVFDELQKQRISETVAKALQGGRTNFERLH